ncbi:MAG: universal stress protein [Leptospira sp.]|nr:universal stress protein [Leptospira sp.]
MIGSILLPMDKSSFTDSGLELSTTLSAKTQTLLEGLVIVDEPTLTQTQAKPLGASGFADRAKETVLKEAFDTADELKEKFESKCKEKKANANFVRKSGHPDEEIINELAHNDLLVLGKKTYFKYATQRENCDTFSKVTHSSFRPVILMPEEIPAVNFDEAVIATDGSPASMKAIQMFTLLGLAKNYTKITIISVASELAKAEKNTANVSKYLAKHKVNSIEKPIQAADTPWEPVLGYIKNHTPSLLVMGVYGTGGIKEFFMGSFTSSLIQNSPIPMFTSR